jgi:lysophospholipase L1-like esterase
MCACERRAFGGSLIGRVVDVRDEPGDDVLLTRRRQVRKAAGGRGDRRYEDGYGAGSRPMEGIAHALELFVATEVVGDGVEAEQNEDEGQEAFRREFAAFGDGHQRPLYVPGLSVSNDEAGAEGTGTATRDGVQSGVMNVRRSAAGGLIVAALGAFCFCSRPERGVVILCAGDSITEQGYPRYLRATLRADGVRARVLNYGRSGNTSAEYLAFLMESGDRLRAEQPDIVLLELGTNDVRLDGDRVTAADFERNIREIVGTFKGFRTRAGGAPAVYLAAIPPVPGGMPFPFGSVSSARVTEEINPAIKSVAEDLGLGFVDNYTLFVRAPDLLPGVHPSPEGYRAMAGNWYAAIRERLRRAAR